MGQLRPKKMTAADIDDVLHWQRLATRRALDAGFDILYVYAGMGYLGYEFLLPEYNFLMMAMVGHSKTASALCVRC